MLERQRNRGQSHSFSAGQIGRIRGVKGERAGLKEFDEHSLGGVEIEVSVPYRQISSRQVDIIRQSDIINLKLREKDKAKEINIRVISIASHQHSH